ncbi:hypothetical protein [Streptomyces sp. NPDC051310]|uniref:hypothetical protein n=1 Tax=Streptomyces sp. NPDC051310 TaxID=3365649 RepID=UPI0037AB760C
MWTFSSSDREATSSPTGSPRTSPPRTAGRQISRSSLGRGSKTSSRCFLPGFFEAQEAAWRHATCLTEYVSAARTRVDAMPPGRARTEAEAWISWAAATVQRLDPLNTPPRLPDIPEPRPDDLKPFLGHWSPYGPTY